MYERTGRANFVDTHSRKQGAAKQKGRFGLFPMNVYATTPGRIWCAGCGRGARSPRDAEHHMDVLTDAIFTQLPPTRRHDLLITVDGGRCSHKLDRTTGPAVYALPEQAWQPMLRHDDTPGETAPAPTSPGWSPHRKQPALRTGSAAARTPAQLLHDMHANAAWLVEHAVADDLIA